jgi:spore coat polysaccharide biosynthesis predicted glycosyltransferase SpsG
MRKSILLKIMRFVIRADAQRKSGAGHVSRCIAVAEEIICRGFEVYFVGNTTEIPWITDLVLNTGFSEILLEDKEFNSNPKSDVLILDSYTLNPESNFFLQDKWLKVIALKDPHTPDFKTHLDVHLNIRDFVPQKIGATIEIGGPRYFPIRSALRIKGDRHAIKFPPRILITSGGGEIKSVLSVITQSLSLITMDYEAIVFTNQPLNIADSRFKRMEIGEMFQNFLKSADLVLTSAGVTSIEIAANEIPMAVYCAVPNQIENYETLVNKGFAYPLGRFDLNYGEIDQGGMIRALGFENLARPEDSLFDFDGARRIVDSIIDLTSNSKIS